MLGFQPRSPPAHGKLRRATAASMVQARKSTVTANRAPLVQGQWSQQRVLPAAHTRTSADLQSNALTCVADSGKDGIGYWSTARSDPQFGYGSQ